MSEASEISNQEKLMGVWEILGKSIGLSALYAIGGLVILYALGFVFFSIPSFFALLFFDATIAAEIFLGCFIASAFSLPTLLILGGFALITSIIIATIYFIDCLKHNKEIIEKQNKFNSKNISPEIQKDKTKGNSQFDNKKFFSDDEQSFDEQPFSENEVMKNVRAFTNF